MRQTFTDLQTDFLQRSGNAGSTDTTLLDFFKRHLAKRYQQVFAEFSNHQTQQTKTASTIAAQQYYHYPAGLVDIEDVTVTVGGIAYLLAVVDSQVAWDRINQVLISTSQTPSFLFPRRDDFGVWPIPQGVYTVTFNYHIRDRSLGVADYTTGTVTATNNSQTVTGSGTTWDASMVGRWFVMNDPTKTGQGYWYRISAFNSTTSLTLETSYEQTTVSGATYKIGESPELPEELHLTLVDGVLSDYYAGPRSDPDKAEWFNNTFWTGDGKNERRDGLTFIGGVLGAKERYSGRSNGAIVTKHSYPYSFTDKMWSSSITAS